MNVETIRVLMAYVIALVLIVGGMVFLFFAMDKPSATQTGLLVVVGGFVGAAIQFVFGSAAGSQSARTFANGVSTPSPAPVFGAAAPPRPPADLG